MLKTSQKTVLSSGLFLFTGLSFSLKTDASPRIRETGVGTRGTGAKSSKLDFSQLLIFNEHKIPFSTAKLTFNNGSLIKYGFENIIHEIETSSRAEELHLSSIQEWILKYKEFLKDKIEESSWELSEAAAQSENPDFLSNINLAFKNGTYSICIIGKYQESFFQVRRNLFKSIAFFIKTQNAPFSVESIEKELSKISTQPIANSLAL